MRSPGCSCAGFSAHLALCAQVQKRLHYLNNGDKIIGSNQSMPGLIGQWLNSNLDQSVGEGFEHSL